MRSIALCLLLSATLWGQKRYARLGELEGAVEMRLYPTGAWRPALRNTPLPEGSSIRTAAAAHAEIELDEGSILRLAGDSSCELSDFTRLSTGQRITHVSLDNGVAYFTGESIWRDALILSLPNSQVSIRRGARVRLEARSDASQLAVLEGEARLSSPAVELTVPEGKMMKLEIARRDRFHLEPEIAALDSDTWSGTRDKLLVGDASRGRLSGLHAGVRDLDAAGEWIDTADFGMAWKPKVVEGWAPFRDGRWQWYDELGFTWIGAETWGWLPYHYGRWMLQSSQGWIWVPGSRRVFKPGDVYWLRGANLAGWGPLAPGETWTGAGPASLYLKSNSTFGRYAPSENQREIDPAGFTAPKDPLAAAAFLESLPSPRISQERLEYLPAEDRPGLIRLSPATWEAGSSQPVTQAPAPPPPVLSSRPVIVSQPVYVRQPLPDPEPVVDTFYSAPLYSGIVVMNPPERKKPDKPNRSTITGAVAMPTPPADPAN